MSPGLQPQGQPERNPIYCNLCAIIIEMETAARTTRLGRWATLLGLLCAVHCALSAVAVALLGALQIRGFDNPWIEAILLAAMVLLAGVSLRHGISHHKSPWPAAMFVGGIVLLLAAHYADIGPWPEALLALLGAAGIVGSNVANMRLQRNGQGCGCSHCSPLTATPSEPGGSSTSATSA